MVVKFGNLGWKTCQTGEVTAFLISSPYRGQMKEVKFDQCLRWWNHCQLTFKFLAEALKNVLSQ